MTNLPREVQSERRILDVRREGDFLAGHVAGAANIPLEELSARAHELPPGDASLNVIDADPQRAAQSAEFLRRRGHAVVVGDFSPTAAVERGPSRVRLWRPSAFLVEAMEQIRGQPDAVPGVAAAALDVACGSGRDAVWLALQGYAVHAIDVLPDALARAEDLARRCGVRIQTALQDVERQPVLPRDRFALVCVLRFLHRPLFGALRQAVAPGGFIVYETFHERNRQTGLPPRRPEHLLRTGELAQAFDGFDFLVQRDRIERDGRFFSALLARKPQ